MWPKSHSCDVAEAEFKPRPSAPSHQRHCAVRQRQYVCYIELAPCFRPFEKTMEVQNIPRHVVFNAAAKLTQ